MSSRRQKAAALRKLMDEEGDAVRTNTRGLAELTDYNVSHFDRYEELREEARAIKEDAIEHLPDLIEEVTEAVEANGGQVYVAANAEEANRYVEDVMAEKDAESLVKSKSMTTEELELNAHLEAAGYEVWETDLGEFVIQLAHETPSHLIGPALHKSTGEIAALFNDHFDLAEPLPDDPQALTKFARDIVGEKILDADVGMTGANFIVAESGTLAIVTNEGNARKSAVTPDTHIAVAGIEKLVPTLEDLQPFVELIARTGTGQDITSYVSLLTPPVETPTIDFEADEFGTGERDFHLVLVDNGRREMRADEDLRETLYCIRCGACANTCANFQAVGGHGFGGETYTGGIGTGWEAGISGLDTAAEFNDLCTGCSQCVPTCPVKIDIPWVNTVVRDRVNRGKPQDELGFLVEGLTPDEEPGSLDLQKRVFGNAGTLFKLGSRFAPVSNWVGKFGPARTLLESVAGIDARRDLPEFAGETLREWMAARELVTDYDRDVVLYPDIYTNYVNPARGKAAVRVLEALGCRVQIPDLAESGRAPLSQGMVETARSQAKTVYGQVAEHIDAGRDIVVIEPSDLTMFRDDYEKFLEPASFERISEASYEVFEYVYGLLENGADASALTAGSGTDLSYHSHCQQRSHGLAVYTEAVLADLGYDVQTSSADCCGMAGSFGYKAEYYEVSMDVGEQLAGEFEGADHVVASGTSCQEQLAAFRTESPPHPIELIQP
ncbi:LUD domain-containing protein [Haladaptatus sp. CMSO5]|uniref:LUD domain-containing protein n=1 Tax=Haladaptatus sp. CMSO5 TaxID=3120514 RepID=UPI002FCE32CF